MNAPVAPLVVDDEEFMPIADMSKLFGFPLLGDAEITAYAVDGSQNQRGRGRPRKTPSEFEIGIVERLASMGLTRAQMSYAVGKHRDTFFQYDESHYSDAIERGRVRLQMTSSSVLMREMLAGNMTAAIWIEKTRLGMTEKVHTVVSNPDGGPVESNVRHSGSVAIGLYLPPNGRDVLADGQKLPTRNPLGLPPNAREVASVDVDASPSGKKGKQ